MILLTLGTRNDKVCLTLTEKVTIMNAFFLFEVWSSQNLNEKKYFTAPDTSLYPDSYNKFSLKALASGSPDTANGEFVAAQTDFWHYKVYQQALDGNLNPALAGDEVESGIMRIDIARPDAVEFNDTQNVITYG